MKKLTIFCALVMAHHLSSGQCAQSANIFSFVHNNKRYEIIKENKSWQEAKSCATARGGYLLEINSKAEQDVVNTELNNAGIINSATRAADGGNASYVWTGGYDGLEEGKWVWQKTDLHFWTGLVTGSSISGAYTNWGSVNTREPDNYLDEQHALGLAITNWPNGLKGEWNDIKETNLLYYIVEHDQTLGVSDVKLDKNFLFYPNPTNGFVHFHNNGMPLIITNVVVYDICGKLVATFQNNKGLIELDFSGFKGGQYIVLLKSVNGEHVTKKVLVK